MLLLALCRDQCTLLVIREISLLRGSVLTIHKTSMLLPLVLKVDMLSINVFINPLAVWFSCQLSL